MPADVDERVRPSEMPDAYVRRVAEAKARTLAGRVEGRVVLAADTTVVIDSEMLGKPLHDQDAKRMLRLLSGRCHEVITGVTVLVRTETTTRVASTSVEFAELTVEYGISWPSRPYPAHVVTTWRTRLTMSARGQ